jgi:DUF4097 and DUF4098 domain-containing protein YvlB
VKSLCLIQTRTLLSKLSSSQLGWRSMLWIAAILLASSTLGPLAGVALADDAGDNEEAEEQSWPTESDVRIQIDLVSGHIEIEAWDRNEVKVEVEGDTANALDVRASRRRVRIRGPRFGRGRAFRNMGDLDVDVRLSVPAGSRIEANTTNGTIRVEGVSGTLDLNSANGDIEVRGTPTEARLETINAGIDFEGAGSLVDARTVNGSIDLTGVAGELFASAISGSIRAEGEALERVELKTLSGSIRLRARFLDGVRANLKSFSGGIEIELPTETSARFDIQSFSGGIRNELPTTRADTPRGNGRRMEFTLGDGDGRVSVESFSGGVEIRERD